MKKTIDQMVKSYLESKGTSVRQLAKKPLSNQGLFIHKV